MKGLTSYFLQYLHPFFSFSKMQSHLLTVNASKNNTLGTPRVHWGPLDNWTLFFCQQNVFATKIFLKQNICFNLIFLPSNLFAKKYQFIVALSHSRQSKFVLHYSSPVYPFSIFSMQNPFPPFPKIIQNFFIIFKKSVFNKKLNDMNGLVGRCLLLA